MSSAPASASNTGTNQSRLQELLSQIPPVTKFLLAFNITIHILIFLFSYSIGNYAISSYQVLWQYEFYRVFSAAFVHVGILHLAMNMSSLFQMGPYLETQFGTLQFMFLTAWAVFVCGGLYVLMGWWVLDWFFQYNTVSFIFLHVSHSNYHCSNFTYCVKTKYEINSAANTITPIPLTPSMFHLGLCTRWQVG